MTSKYRHRTGHPGRHIRAPTLAALNLWEERPVPYTQAHHPYDGRVHRPGYQRSDLRPCLRYRQGFLVNSYEYILKKYTSKDKIEEDPEGGYHNLLGDKITEPKHWDKLWTDTFYGYDFDATMVRISLMNMVLHGIKPPQVALRDTLSKGFTENNRYTVVLANPPFKGSIDKSDINDSLTIQTTKTELLFVERMMHLLQIGGKCGVIVPDGVLFGSSNAHKKLRQILLEKCQLEGIVSMPSGVFKPYAGVSTAVLIFTKGGSTEKVWFYDMDADGSRSMINGHLSMVKETFRISYSISAAGRKKIPWTGNANASLCRSRRSGITGSIFPSHGTRRLSMRKFSTKSRK